MKVKELIEMLKLLEQEKEIKISEVTWGCEYELETTSNFVIKQYEDTGEVLTDGRIIYSVGDESEDKDFYIIE